MTLKRPFLLSALCAFALPMAAFGDVPATAGTPATGAACNCDQVCAQREQASAQARADARHRAALRARRNRNGAIATRGMATMRIDTRIARPVAENCEYRATAQGTYRSSDPAGLRGANVPVHDLDVHADATLACGGNVVRRTSQRWVFPTTTQHQIADLMHQRLALQVPGSKCEWASTYGFEGGNLASRGVAGTCERGASLAAVEGYNANANPSAMGGGPRVDARGGKRFTREPTANDARTGAH